MKLYNYPTEEDEKNFGCVPVALAIILGFFLILTIVCSCTTTRYVPVESVRTEYRDKLQRDSIYLKDSVYIREKGDTVLYERWNTKYVGQLRVDSFIKHDSIPVPYPVEVIKTVEKKLSWWQSIKMELGGLAMGLLIVILGYVIFQIVKTVKSSGWKGLLTFFK